jgi:CDGSH iron-sulfur domain-containing protein 3
MPPVAVNAMAESAPPSAGPIPLELPAGVHQLCRCGRSRHGWFCDGAHLGTGWVSRELRLDQASTVMVCGCGLSHRYPLCDGRHAKPASSKRWWRWWA